MKIEVLYIAGCPNHQLAVDRLQEALRGAAISEQVVEIEVSTPAQAVAFRFIGSPMIRINGLDVEPEARAVQHFGLVCRTYLEDNRSSGLPSANVIRLALSEALVEESASLHATHNLERREG